MKTVKVMVDPHIEIKLRNCRIILNIVASAIIVVFVASWTIFLTIPFIEKQNLSAVDYWGGYVGLSFLYFTRQTGFFALFYACYMLQKRNKHKVSNAIGIFVNAQFIIVNLIAWVVINNVIEKNNDPWFITVDILNHGVLFILTLILFLISLFLRIRPGYDNIFDKTLSIKHMILFGGIAPTIFWIGSLIINFIKLSEEWFPNTNGYWSIYGPLTNFNPAAGGLWWMALIIIPAFYGVLILLQTFFRHLDTLRFRRDRIDHTWRTNHFSKVVRNNKLLMGIFFTSIIVYAGAIIFSLIANILNYEENVMLWIAFCLMTIGTALIIYSGFLFRHMHTIYILRVVNDVSMIFAVLSWIGCISHLFIHLFNYIDFPIGVFETLSMYAAFPLVASIFNTNYTYLHYQKIYAGTPEKK
jgi:hypothetical protein